MWLRAWAWAWAWLAVLWASPARAARAGLEGAPVDYCALCEPRGSHTMCLFPEAGAAANCSGYRSAPLSPREQRAIVRAHNVVRNRVASGRAWARAAGRGRQPAAAAMRELRWDAELAAVAQRWADRCLPFYTASPHDACRDVPRFPVGQNIVSTAFSKAVSSDVRVRVLDWYAELAHFEPSWVASFAPNADPDPAKQIGHYAQMVWGWTHSVGCARVVFQERLVAEAAPWMVERIVCNYAPSGNYLGQPLYVTGAPCSRCPAGTAPSPRYPALCALVANGSRAAEAADAEGVAAGAAEDPANALLAASPALWGHVAAAADEPVDEGDAAERLSDERVVLDGVEAIEHGSRPQEAYKTYGDPPAQSSAESLDAEDQVEGASEQLEELEDASDGASLGTSSDSSKGSLDDPSVGTSRDVSKGSLEDALLGTSRDASKGSLENASLGTSRDVSKGSLEDPSVRNSKGVSKGNLDDASLGTSRDVSKGSLDDPSVGNSKDVSKGSLEDASLGTSRDVSKGSLEDPSVGNSRDISKGSLEKSSLKIPRDFSKGNLNVTSAGNSRDVSKGSLEDASLGTSRHVSEGILDDPSVGTYRQVSRDSLDDASLGTSRDVSKGSFDDLSLGTSRDVSTGAAKGDSTGTLEVAWEGGSKGASEAAEGGPAFSTSRPSLLAWLLSLADPEAEVEAEDSASERQSTPGSHWYWFGRGASAASL